MEISDKIRKRVKKLSEAVDDYRYRYHVLDDPTVTDEVYDPLMNELRQLENKYPGLRTLDSPTQRIGGEPLKLFTKTKHKKRQWSLNDAFSFEEMVEWEKRLQRILDKDGRQEKLDYTVELKIDGLKIILDYDKGALVRGATRGDGIIGEDVTENIKTIQSVPLKLPQPLTLTVVGECWLSETELRRINKQRKKEGTPQFANSRNAAAGAIRQLDSQVAASRKLDSFIYDIVSFQVKDKNIIPKTQFEELKLLSSLKFKTNKHFDHCSNLEEIRKIYKGWSKKRNKQDYGIDGLVIKVNNIALQRYFGHTGKSPRFAIAWKFPTEKTTTVIKDITVQIGRTGALTPVAILRPVLIAGSTVSRASLHNEDEIEKKNIKIGDTVVIHKAGDVIPEVIEVIKKLRTGKEKTFSMPKKCPICGGDVKREKILDKKKSGSAAHYCTNKKCFAIEREKITHFVSKKAFNIDGFGEKIVEQLINEGLVSSVADIFGLKKGDLEVLERFAEKSAENLVESIEKSKKIQLEKFFVALGIRHLGEEGAILISKELGLLQKKNIKTPRDLAEFMKNISRERLESIAGVGEMVALSIKEWFDQESNKKSLKDLSAFGVCFDGSLVGVVQSEGIFKGKSVVLTGTLENLTRSDAKDLIRRAGGKTSSAVSAKTDFVVVGNDSGSKEQKAKKLGVPVINETELMEKLKIKS